MDPRQMEPCLKRVAAYRASGQTARVWTEANDVPIRAIASWCAQSRCWQARLECVSAGPSLAPRSSGFVAARVAVLFEFTTNREGEHPRRVAQSFGDTLVSEDYLGHFGLRGQGVTAALCWAHARRKRFESLELNGSEIAGQAVTLIAKLYELERGARELQPEARWLQLRQKRQIYRDGRARGSCARRLHWARLKRCLAANNLLG